MAFLQNFLPASPLLPCRHPARVCMRVGDGRLHFGYSLGSAMNDAEIFREHIGPQVVVSDAAAHQSDDLRDSLQRDSAIVVPFRKGLRREAHRVGERDLRPEASVAAGESSPNLGAHDHKRAFYICAFIWSMCGFIAAKESACQNKPMVYRNRLEGLPKLPDPALYKSFQHWITDVCGLQYGVAAVIARHADRTHPAVKSWCAGVVPQPNTLKTLATNLKQPLVTYEKLQALVDAGSRAQQESEGVLTGAELERTGEYANCWKELAGHADLQAIAIQQMQALCQLARSRETTNSGADAGADRQQAPTTKHKQPRGG